MRATLKKMYAINRKPSGLERIPPLESLHSHNAYGITMIAKMTVTKSKKMLKLFGVIINSS